MSSESVYFILLHVQVYSDTFHTVVNLEWRKGRLYGFSSRHLRRKRHGVDCGMSSSRLGSVSGLAGAALRSLPTIVHSFLRRAWSSWVFCDAQAPVTWNSKYRWLMLFLTGGYFPILVRKLRCTATIDRVWAYSGTQKAFCAPFAA